MNGIIHQVGQIVESEINKYGSIREGDDVNIGLEPSMIYLIVWLIMIWVILKSRNLIIVSIVTMLNIYLTLIMYNEEMILFDFPVFFIGIAFCLIGIYRVIDAVAGSKIRPRKLGGFR